MKKSGILMPVASLPSRTGVGEMGAEAYRISRIPPVREMNCISAWIFCMKKDY